MKKLEESASHHILELKRKNYNWFKLNMIIEMWFINSCPPCNTPRGDPNPASCAIARRSRREQIFIENSSKATKNNENTLNLIFKLNSNKLHMIIHFSQFFIFLNFHKSNYGQSCSKRNLDINTDLKSSHFTLKTNLRDLLLSLYFLFKNDFKVAENISASNIENEPFGP